MNQWTSPINRTSWFFHVKIECIVLDHLDTQKSITSEQMHEPFALEIIQVSHLN